MKKTNKKGFTLAELLVVVAIIAVLVAIAIPIFTSQLEKAREAVDAANIRAAYAEVLSDKITAGNSTTEIKTTVKLTQTKQGWQNEFDFPENLTPTTATPGTPAAEQPTGTKDQEVTIKATEDGATINILLVKKAG